MKKSILALNLLATTLASCGDGKLSVTEYNDKAIGIYNPIDQKVAGLEQVITGDAADVPRGIAAIESCTKSLDSGLTELQKLKTPDKAMPLHTSIIGIMKFEKDTMLPIISKMVKAQGDATMLSGMESDLTNMSNRATVLTNTMQTEQQKLAASVGATVEE